MSNTEQLHAVDVGYDIFLQSSHLLASPHSCHFYLAHHCQQGHFPRMWDAFPQISISIYKMLFCGHLCYWKYEATCDIFHGKELKSLVVFSHQSSFVSICIAAVCSSCGHESCVRQNDTSISLTMQVGNNSTNSLLNHELHGIFSMTK